MKKILKCVVCILIVLCLSACGKKVEMKSNDLANELSNLGFDVTDITSQLEDDNIKKVYAANNKKYQMEIYIFKNENDAKKAYTTNKATFIDIYKSKYDEDVKDTYEAFYQEADGKYNQLSRVGSTFVYASVNVEYKKDVKKSIKRLGY